MPTTVTSAYSGNPAIPPIPDSTLFMGDSMTVGTPQFVKVTGAKDTIAQVGQTSAWLLGQAQKYPDFAKYKNMVMLIGANDIGGGLSADAIFQNIENTWKIGKANGLTVYGATLPPVKGWPGFASNFAAVNSKRKAINTKILASPVPDQVIRYDLLMADPNDIDSMSDYYNSGDHLHPTKTRMGTLIQASVTGTMSKLVSPAIPSASAAIASATKNSSSMLVPSNQGTSQEPTSGQKVFLGSFALLAMYGLYRGYKAVRKA